MKIVCISDTHTFANQIEVPDGDVLIHAGDATISGEYFEVKDFAEWFAAQPHKHKIFVAGNHDWLFQREPELARSLLYGVAHYLQDSNITIDGVKFYGSPWQPNFNDWAFNLARGDAIKAKWDLIPQCDVLITHGPIWGVLDTVLPNAQHLGCEDLAEAMQRVKPKLHICGHIHGGHGEYVRNGTHFVNASICDEAYRISNKPIIVEI